MKINRALSFHCGSLPTTLRVLTPDDITEEYLVALRRERHFLLNCNPEITRAEQNRYVEKITCSTASAIFGLFGNAELIGTVGVQHLDSADGAALGVFIFNSRFADRGFGKVAVWAACYLVHHTMSVDKFRAGIAHNNPASRRVFSACGFSLKEKRADKLVLSLEITQLETQLLITADSIVIR
jgi:RimJ/RimL family protein N-acetyltransferase